MKKKKPFGARALDLAVLSAVCWVMGAYVTYGLNPDAGWLLSPPVEGGFGLLFFGLGAILSLAAILAAVFQKGQRVAPVSAIVLLGWASGGTVAGVVQHERGNFYSLMGGIFASILLALVASQWAAPVAPGPERAPRIARRPVPTPGLRPRPSMPALTWARRREKNRPGKPEG